MVEHQATLVKSLYEDKLITTEIHDTKKTWIYRDADQKLGGDRSPLEGLLVGTNYPKTWRKYQIAEFLRRDL